MIAKRIKESLDTIKVVEYYGYKPNRQGFISCPFHKEKTASLKIYNGNRGWNCYGCGKNGSVIDFVMNVFGLTLSQAILRLNYDFNLGLTNSKLTMRQKNELRRKISEEQKFEEVKKLINEYWTIEFKIYYRQYHENKPKNKFEELNEQFVEALQKLPYINYMLGGDYYF